MSGSSYEWGLSGKIIRMNPPIAEHPPLEWILSGKIIWMKLPMNEYIIDIIIYEWIPFKININK
jgi:hypothetical protein